MIVYLDMVTGTYGDPLDVVNVIVPDYLAESWPDWTDSERIRFAKEQKEGWG